MLQLSNTVGQTQNIKQHMTHKMGMNPQMIAKIGLLGLSIPDLKIEINKELENPALKLKSSPSQNISFEDLERYDTATTKEINLKDGLRNFSLEKDLTRVSSYAVDSDSFNRFIQGAVSHEETIQEHLLVQLGEIEFTEREHEMGEWIISSLDENGFFPTKKKEEVEEKRYPKKFNDDELAPIIEEIQNFDPEGCATSSEIESLVIQAEIRGDAPEFFKEIVTGDLAGLCKGKISQIAKKYKREEFEVEELICYLGLLNPYPGRVYQNHANSFVIPDLKVTRRGGGFEVLVNNEEIPSLSLDKEFRVFLEDKEDKNTCQFAKQQIQMALGVIDVLQLRRELLGRVGHWLLKKQNGFFQNGKKELVPLFQKEMASDLNVSKSTISRMVREKYMETDWGIFPLAFFFSSSVKTAENEIASNSVKEMISEIIDNDMGDKKLSDQKIADILKEKGVDIARRTVAKYRSKLDSPSISRGIL